MLVPTKHTAAAFRSAVDALSKGSLFSRLLTDGRATACLLPYRPAAVMVSVEHEHA